MDGCKLPWPQVSIIERILTSVQTVSDISFSASSSPRRLKRLYSLVQRLQLPLVEFLR
jgi:hypothetical protein